MKLAISSKRIQVDKANTTVVIAIALASVVTVFSLVASRALLSQRSFQSKVIEKKTTALEQLNDNVEATSSLVTAYRDFVSSPENVIKGSSMGSGERDGDNARIVLDALPSKYDFPAVATSIEKILIGLNLDIESIEGTDEEVAQGEEDTKEPIEIPFEFAVNGSYEGLQELLKSLQLSIRPMQVTEMTFSSTSDTINLNYAGKTYYKPQTGVDIKKETIR